MPDANAQKGLRERLAGSTEDRLGKALTDLFENSLLNGALGRASDAREKAAQAQELAMGALNLPSAADIERLTRRLRSVSQRLEGIEDGVHRLGRSLSGPSIDARLASIEGQLQTLSRTLGDVRESLPGKQSKSAGAQAPESKVSEPSAAAAPKRTASSARRATPAPKRTASAARGATPPAPKRTAAQRKRTPGDRPPA